MINILENNRQSVFPILVVLTILLGFACSGGGPATNLLLSEAEKQTAIDTIVQTYGKSNGVLAGKIAQDGNDVDLIIIINSTEYLPSYGPMNKEKGKEIGKHFVKLIKNGGTDDPAVNGIGKGKFNYSIGVYYQDVNNPDKTFVNPLRKIVTGKKKAKSSTIKWD